VFFSVKGLLESIMDEKPHFEDQQLECSLSYIANRSLFVVVVEE